MRGYSYWGLVLVLVVGAARAEEPRGRLVQDVWNAAYLGKAKAGYVRTSVYEIERDGQKILRATLELKLQLKRFQDRVELRMESGTEETPEGKVVGVFTRQYLGKNQQMELTGAVKDNQLHVLVDGGQRQKKVVPWNDEVIGLYRQDHLFAERKVKPGDTFSYSSYEPSLVAVVTNRVRIQGLEEVEVLGKKHKLLRIESVPDKIGDVRMPALVAWLDDKYQTVRSQFEIPGLGPITLYRTTSQKALSNDGQMANVPADIGRSSLLPLNRRISLEQPYEARSVVYRITLKNDDDPTRAIVQDGRQQIKNVRGNTFELHVRAGQLPARDSGEKVGPEYLESSYFINCADALVQKRAREAVGTAAEAWQKARLVEKYVHDKMGKDFSEAFATADEAARTLRGDCTEHAMLSAAMCRAVGVPSQVAVGLLYVDLPRGPVMGFHMWTEVWVRGQWIPIDATLGRGFVGATHLKIAEHSWHDTQSLKPLLPVMRVLGKLTIEVLSVNGQE